MLKNICIKNKVFTHKADIYIIFDYNIFHKLDILISLYLYLGEESFFFKFKTLLPPL